MEKDKMVDKNILTELMERGRKLIYSQRQNEWEGYFNRKFYGNHAYLSSAIEIMEKLDSGEESEKILINTDLQDISRALVLVTIFAKRGVEFYREIFKNDISVEAEEFLDMIDKENTMCEAGLMPIKQNYNLEKKQEYKEQFA